MQAYTPSTVTFLPGDLSMAKALHPPIARKTITSAIIVFLHIAVHSLFECFVELESVEVPKMINVSILHELVFDFVVRRIAP